VTVVCQCCYTHWINITTMTESSGALFPLEEEHCTGWYPASQSLLPVWPDSGYILPSSTRNNIASPHYGHITLPLQEEMCRCCSSARPVFPAHQPNWRDRFSWCVYIQVLQALGILLPTAGRLRLIPPIPLLLVQLAVSRREVSWMIRQVYSGNADNSIPSSYSLSH